MAERGFGHVPGQAWHGGYGGDRDLGGYDARPNAYAIGRGFTGNDFGGGDFSPRHFGNEVDRGGRMPPGAHYGPYGYDAPYEDRGPHYGKGPKGYVRSDERTREDVCEAIAHQGHVDASEVDVGVEGGVVTLSGTVAHRAEKRLLEHLAEGCRGVVDVHNELRLARGVVAKVSAGERAAGGGANANANANANAKNGRSVGS